jgi:hypothetical protein
MPIVKLPANDLQLWPALPRADSRRNGFSATVGGIIDWNYAQAVRVRPGNGSTAG